MDMMTLSVTQTTVTYSKGFTESPKSTVAEAETAQQTAKQDTYVSSKATQDTDEITYSPNTSLVDQLKAEQDAVQSRFLNTVRDMLSKQGKEVAIGEGIWKTLASGDFEVDAETQAAAKEAISENGYWGVKQTATRIVNFAKALVGGDPSRVECMREAFIKGFHAATETWGSALPDITNDTYDTAMKLFDDWAKEGQESEEVQENGNQSNETTENVQS